MNNFIKQLQAASAVSTPLVAIRTFDNSSVISGVEQAFKEGKKAPSMLVWDCLKGLKAVSPAGGEVLDKALKAADINAQMTPDLVTTLGLINTPKNGIEDTFVFLQNVHLFWSEANIIQGIWNLRNTFKISGSMLVLLVSSGAILPAEIASDVLVLDESLPTESDLATVVRDTFKFANLSEPDTSVINKATAALIGLPFFPAEQSVAMCLDRENSKLDIDGLWARKRQTINQTKGLSVYTGKDKFDDLGGIQNVKNFLTRIMEGNNAPQTIIFIDEIEKAFAGAGTDTSGVKTELTGAMLSWMEDKQVIGIMFIGLPGVGKSQLPKTLGNKYGIPFIKFDLAGMQESLVGNSGTNFRNATAVVDAVSGGKVLAIATCNSIDSLPPELQSRFQLATFFFDAPTEEERESIWKTYRDVYKIQDSKLPEANGWTGREIKGCCEKAYRLNISLIEAGKYVVPCTISNAAKIEFLRRNSSGKYLSASNEGMYRYKPNEEIEVESILTGRKMKN